MTLLEDSSVHSYLKRIHAISEPGDCSNIYNEWAATYDTDVKHAGVDYVGPELVALSLKAVKGDVNGAILDAGCGTGLVGRALAKAGATIIDGIDISPGMLDVARKAGVYRNLEIADMTMPIGKPDQYYDMITCCGTFTEGHVGPVPGLRELARIVKPGGFIVCTIVDEVWIPGGYKAEVDRLVSEGGLELVSAENMDYRRGTDMKARMVILTRKQDQLA